MGVVLLKASTILTWEENASGTKSQRKKVNRAVPAGRLQSSIIDSFRSELKGRDFEDKNQYASNAEFLRDKIADLCTRNLRSLAHEERMALFYSLNACVCLLQSGQEGEFSSLDDLIQSINTLAATSGELFRVHTRARVRFREIVKELKTIAKGSILPGARILYEPHWKEVTGLNLMIDGKLYSGRINLRYFHSHGANYWEKWKTGVNEKGVPNINLYSFESFLNEVVIPSLDKEKKAELIEACGKIVEFYTPEELAPLQVIFDKNGKACTLDGRLNAWIKHIADANKNKKELEFTFRTFLKNQPTPAKKRLTPIEPTEDQFMYVLTTSGKLYFQKEQKGRAQHVSLSGGQAILATGEILLNPDSSIKMINPLSGHYRPKKTQMVSILRFLQVKGVDIDQLTLKYGSSKNLKVIEPGKGRLVSDWLKAEQEK